MRERKARRIGRTVGLAPWRAHIVALLGALVLAPAGCGRDDRQPAAGRDREAAGSQEAVPAARDPAAPVHAPEDLDRAAREVIAFLRDRTGADRIRLADTVILQLAPEGGGTRRAVARDRLRDRAAWVIVADGGGTAYSLVPPEGLTELTTAVGRHFNCMEGSLATKAARLAALPHVGTRLTPPDASSCLQSWNLTLVFAPEIRPPTLVAALYDQWEW